MRRLLSVILVAWIACMTAFSASASIKCKGFVNDEMGEPIIGASVVVTNGKAVGVTDYSGAFNVTVPDNAKTLTFSYVGYNSKTAPVRKDMGTITLEPSTQALNDVVVTQSLAKTRQTPVAVSQVNKAEIDVKLGTQELPEILNTTPGVWATKSGGGFGDAKINMRGFQSANVAVLVNGIPVNDMEGGWVYWSNWAGLNGVASNIQTQRGLGAAILSSPSIGGTINITTESLDAERGGYAYYGMGSDGLNDMGVKVSTGLTKDGWAVTAMGAHKWGEGWVQGTAYDAYNYFVNVSKKINEQHQLSFTAFGSPQVHDKRGNYDGLSIKEYQTYGRRVMGDESPYRYNATFGYDLHGQVRSSNRNTYHKPQMSLAHIWKIDNESSLSTTVYASIAKGGGMSGQGRGQYKGNNLSNSSWYGATNGVVNTLFRHEDGTFAYDEIQLMNQASTTGSNMVMSESNNSHNWYGLISTYNKSFWEKTLNVLGGIDLRYYEGLHNNKIIDLYDGEYFMDDSSRKNVKAYNNAAAAAGNAYLYEKLTVGDIVYRDYTGYTQQEGAYLQGELNLLDRKLNIVASGSLNNTSYKRVDRFYYDAEHGTTPWYHFWGGTVKGGINYNIDRHNNVFFNAGFISRAPFFANGVFLSQATSNAVNPNPINEKVQSAEVGYNFRSQFFSATANAYYTMWKDKTQVKGGVIELGDHAGDRYVMNLAGVNARHTGIEFNATYIPTKWLEINGMLSVGDYIWDSNAKGFFYNQLGEPLKNAKGDLASGIFAEDHAWGVLNQKGIKVGGSAQTTAAISATFRPLQGMRIGIEWKANDRNYSDYTISTPDFNKEINIAKPWQIPFGQQFDLNASYSFKMAGFNATLIGNVHNLFNNYYIVDANSNSAVDANWENIYGTFYSFGRTFSCKLRVKF